MNLEKIKIDNKQCGLSCSCYNPAADVLIGIIAKRFKDNPKDKKPTKEPIIDKVAFIFTGGTILPVVTIDSNGNEIIDARQTVDAMGISNGKIVTVGSEDDVKEKIQEITSGNYGSVDLKGKTLVPGFIESHVHMDVASVLWNWNDYSPFDGQKLRLPYDLDWLKDRLKNDLTEMQNNIIKKDYWLLGKEVDVALLAFPKYPNANLLTLIDAEFLDDVDDNLKGIPILLISSSLHTVDELHNYQQNITLYPI